MTVRFTSVWPFVDEAWNLRGQLTMTASLLPSTISSFTYPWSRVMFFLLIICRQLHSIFLNYARIFAFANLKFFVVSSNYVYNHWQLIYVPIVLLLHRQSGTLKLPEPYNKSWSKWYIMLPIIVKRRSCLRSYWFCSRYWLIRCHLLKPWEEPGLPCEL